MPMIRKSLSVFARHSRGAVVEQEKLSLSHTAVKVLALEAKLFPSQVRLHDGRLCRAEAYFPVETSPETLE